MFMSYGALKSEANLVSTIYVFYCGSWILFLFPTNATFAQLVAYSELRSLKNLREWLPIFK